MNRLSLLSAAVMLLATSASAQDKASQKFLTEAIEGNFAEVKMGELAEKNGQSGLVKSFGETLKADHTAANKKALEAARALGMNPPAEPSAKQKQDYDHMAKMNGPAFDKAFAEHMVADHKKDIAEYQEAAKKQDAAGKYATEALPTLQKHLETANGLEKDSAAPRQR